MKKLFTLFFLLPVLTTNAQQKKSVRIDADTLKLYNTDSSGLQLLLKNGTENRGNSFLKNKGNGLTEFNYAVDSVWFATDTLYIQRATLSKYRIGSDIDSVTNGISTANGIARLGGNLNRNTQINWGGHTYELKKDSVNFTSINPLNFTSTRQNSTGYKSLIDQQSQQVEIASSNTDSSQSRLFLTDSSGSFSFRKNTASSSCLLLKDRNINISSDQIYFNGNWVRLPGKTKEEMDSLAYKPAGSLLYNKTTGGLSLSNGNSMNPAYWEFMDGQEIQTTLPMGWATTNNYKVPVLRLHHPSTNQDFKIFPYQYGIAAEYNGVFENWVGEFSIHRGLQYYDMGDGGDGWGAVLWVGDDEDRGGLRMTARDNTQLGGNIKFTEIASEEFGGQISAGDIRLRMIDSTDRVNFIIGKRGTSTPYSYIGTTGLKLPDVHVGAMTTAPDKGLLVFDNDDSSVKVFNGNAWKKFNTNTETAITISDNIAVPSTGNIVYYVDASLQDVTLSLPAATVTSTGILYKIIRLDNSSNKIVINTVPGSSINGTESKVLTNQYESMNVYSAGINKWIATKEVAF